MVKIAIPGFICEITDEDRKELEKLMFKFGKARRRAYSLKWKGIQKSDIERILQKETGLNSRYVKDAYHSIKDLPPHVTFGGKRNQLLRMKGKISREEYIKRRNSILISRGEKSQKGNLNTRLDLNTMKLRINCCNGRYIYPKIYIPEKYLEKYGEYLDGSHPYTVIIKRLNDDRGFKVYFIVDVETFESEGDRVMALDINAGHTDFAVVDKKSKKIVAVGKFSHHETQYVRRGKRTYLLHKLVDRIGVIARHFNADVVVGKLETSKFNGSRKANRVVHNMPQFKFRQILSYKLPLKYGVRVKEYSEAYTSKIGKVLGRFVGLDVHKASAIAFALKVVDYSRFKLILSEVRSDEANGRRRAGRRRGCGLTAPCQSRLEDEGLAGDEASRQRLTGDPRYPVLSALAESVKANLTGRLWHVKIC